MNTLPFCSYKQAMIREYGVPLYRVALDLGLGCPNRAADGSGGCAFCPPDGSTSPQARDAKSLEEQVQMGIDFARKRYGATKFMAYIQTFTGTFAPASEQRDRVREILALFPFDALTIGTRPDCLPPDTLDFLEELRNPLDLWIELGIQTIHNETLARIERGHTWQQSLDAIDELHRRNIKVAVHVILGLPGETPQHFSATATALAGLPLHGIKIHNLHVIKGTRLAHQYEQQPFSVYTPEAYRDILIDFLRRLPADLPVMRINTDTERKDLVAPRWSLAKAPFRDMVIREMNRLGVVQGDLCG